MRSFRTMTNLAAASLVVFCSWVVIAHADWLQDLQQGRTLQVAQGVRLKVDKLPDANQTSYFSSHVLKLFLGDVGLALSKAKGKEGLQIGLFTPAADGNEARGEANVFSVVLPLLIGFKIAGSILTTLIAVLVVSVKAFLASKLSLLLTGAGALKKMMSHDHAEVHYPPMEYYHPPTGYDYPYPSAAGYQAHPPSGPSAPGHEDGDHVGPSASDSNTSAQYAAPNNTTNTGQYNGVKRRVYRRKNQIIPVLTVSKFVRKENS